MYEDVIEWEGIRISLDSLFLVFSANMKVLYPLCTFTWRVNIFVSSQGKFMIERKETSRFSLCVTGLVVHFFFKRRSFKQLPKTTDLKNTIRNWFSSECCSTILPLMNSNTGEERKNQHRKKKNLDEHTGINLSRDKNVPKVTEYYITQV